jgi:hypothetical protein
VEHHDGRLQLIDWARMVRRANHRRRLRARNQVDLPAAMAETDRETTRQPAEEHQV